MSFQLKSKVAEGEDLEYDRLAVSLGDDFHSSEFKCIHACASYFRVFSFSFLCVWPFFFLFTPFLSVLPPPSCFFLFFLFFSPQKVGGEGGAFQYMWGLWIVIRGLLHFFFRFLYSISSVSAPFAMWGGYCTVWRRFTQFNISCIRKFSHSVVLLRLRCVMRVSLPQGSP